MTSEYKTQPFTVKDARGNERTSDGVYVNKKGSWAGVVVVASEDQMERGETPSGYTISPHFTKGGVYIPAPENWRDLVIEKLQEAI